MKKHKLAAVKLMDCIDAALVPGRKPRPKRKTDTKPDPRDRDPLFGPIFNAITHHVKVSQMLFSQRRAVAFAVLEAVREFECKAKST